MQHIDQLQPSEDFMDAWQAAGRHLQRLGGDSMVWIRADLDTPFIEHLAFRLGNQLVFVYLLTEESVSDEVLAPFHELADMAHAIPCLMPMNKGIRGYEAALPGWGLRHSRTEGLVDV
ncbi:MAG: hypothetical protein V2I45_00100, partial [Halieaceae bacterium]|nr:hypothetical protein [Halieaceae bacterium]